MAVERATVTRDVWDTIRAIIAADATVTGITSQIHGTYPTKFIKKAGGLPFVIIHKPEISEENFTTRKKKYPVRMNIESFTDNAADLKDLDDAVRNALESGESTTRYNGNNLFHFMVVNNASDIELRNDKRIHSSVLRVQYMFIGGGAN